MWTNNVKDLEINVGDEISVLSSMVSTNGGGGDEYIQITDREVDGVKENEVTLEFELYKSADAKGIISLPYHAVNFAAPNATYRTYFRAAIGTGTAYRSSSTRTRTTSPCTASLV